MKIQQNLWDTATAVWRGKFVAYVKKEEKCQINNVISYLKNLEKEEQNKPKASKRKGKMKTRAEINEIEN